MRERCRPGCANPSADKHYVQKGVSVCELWGSFPEFAAWALANGYADNLTIDRIDSDGDYCPDNCRWVTMAENLRSRADRKLKDEDAKEIRRLRSEGISGATLAARFGVSRNHIYRVGRGERWQA